MQKQKKKIKKKKEGLLRKNLSSYWRQVLIQMYITKIFYLVNNYSLLSDTRPLKTCAVSISNQVSFATNNFTLSLKRYNYCKNNQKCNWHEAYSLSRSTWSGDENISGPPCKGGWSVSITDETDNRLSYTEAALIRHSDCSTHITFGLTPPYEHTQELCFELEC